MKRTTYISILVLIVLSLMLAACGSTAADDSNTITVATDATFPPFEIVDEATSDLTGFDIELMNAIAERAGLTVEYVNTPFDSVVTGVSECQYDAAIAAITITPEREAVMLFSEPYISAGQIVVVQASNTTITGVQDLTGLTVAAQLGTTGEIEAQNIEGVTYVPYDTYDLAFLDLVNGQVDAVIADYPTALGFIGMHPELATAGEVFTNESYGIAICSTNTELQSRINTALQSLIDDGTVAQLEQTWLAGVSQ